MKTILRTILISTLLLIVPAAWAVTPDAARTLLEQKDLPFDNDTFVKMAAEHDFEAVELFLEAGINPDVEDQYGNTAMLMATMQGYDEILELLIDHGADTEVKDTKFQATPLIWAALTGCCI